jgi:hypothetical protein
LDFIAIGKALADLGGWSAFLVLSVALAVSVIKGWLVPGRYFDREVARGDKAETQATRNAEALEALSKATTGLPEGLRSLREALDIVFEHGFSRRPPGA